MSPLSPLLCVGVLARFWRLDTCWHAADWLDVDRCIVAVGRLLLCYCTTVASVQYLLL